MTYHAPVEMDKEDTIHMIRKVADALESGEIEEGFIEFNLGASPSEPDHDGYDVKGVFQDMQNTSVLGEFINEDDIK